MNIFKSFFSKNDSSEALKLRYSKSENNWRVTKAYEIIYIGDLVQCKTYIQNMKNSNSLLV